MKGETWVMYKDFNKCAKSIQNSSPLCKTYMLTVISESKPKGWPPYRRQQVVLPWPQTPQGESVAKSASIYVITHSCISYMYCSLNILSSIYAFLQPFENEIWNSANPFLISRQIKFNEHFVYMRPKNPIWMGYNKLCGISCHFVCYFLVWYSPIGSETFFIMHHLSSLCFLLFFFHYGNGKRLHICIYGTTDNQNVFWTVVFLSVSFIWLAC